MAGSTSDYHHGDMDIHEQKASYDSFLAMAKWGSLVVAVGVLFATLWFCTQAGFGSAFAAAVVVAVIGVVVLGRKPSAH
jgi:hypothetical protein